LGGQVNPNVQNPVFVRVFLKGVLQISFNPLHHVFGPLKVVQVPLVIRLCAVLFADRPVRQQVVEKLNAEHVHILQIFELRNVYVLPFRDVEEHTVHEKEEGLDVQVLAPGQTEVKEELREAFVVNALP
jgi:hypothetical protein